MKQQYTSTHTAAEFDKAIEEHLPSVKLTQAEYDALVTAQKIRNGVWYRIYSDAHKTNLVKVYEGGKELAPVDSQLDKESTNPVENKAITKALAGKQETLVSGQNLATINKQSLLGGGDIQIEAGEIYDDGPLKARISKEVNEYNISGINGTTYADLSSALLALNTYMTSQKIHPEVGVKVTFVQTDIKRAKTFSWQKQGTFTDVANWSNEPLGGYNRKEIEMMLGAKYNPSTNTYSLGTLIDLTAEQILATMSCILTDANINIANYFRSFPMEMIKNLRIIKANIYPVLEGPTIKRSLYNTFFGCENVEEILLGDEDDEVKFTTIRAPFTGCRALERIQGIITFDGAPLTFERPFISCYALETVKIKNLNSSISLSDSKRLSFESVDYMVQNSTNVRPITITLHPNVFDLLSAQYIADVLAQHQITIKRA